MAGFRVTEMYAFLTVGDDGDEGVPAIQLGTTALPMVAADQDRIQSLRTAAQKVADTNGHPVELVRFSVRETVETISPRT